MSTGGNEQRQPGRDPGFALALAAAGLPALLAVGSVAIVIAALLGYHPFWQGRSGTLAEAAVRGDAAMIASLVERGVDPNVRSVVRPGLVSSAEVELLPIEGAIALGDVNVFRQLVEAGANVSGDQGVYIACLAVLRDAPQVLAYLAERGTLPVDERCAGVELPY